MKYRKISLSIFLGAILIGSIVIYSNRAVLFQCGNPVPYIVKMFALSEDLSYLDVFADATTYITKRGESEEFLKFIADEYKATFKDQAGSGILFESDTQQIIVSSQVYWRYYRVWSVHIV